MTDQVADEALLTWLVSRCFGEQDTLKEEPRRKRRRYWVHPIVSARPERGQFYQLYTDLRRYPDKFQNYCRMTIATFDRLLADLRPGLLYRDTISCHSFACLHYEFALGISTISSIVGLTCSAILERLRAQVMPPPQPEDWTRITGGFEATAQFPNCIGALDGKHIRVQKPSNSGSLYFNYKHYFSVVLLALADSDYRFVVVDIGAYGSAADTGVFRASRIGEMLKTNHLGIPESRPLPGSSGPPAPFVIVADEGFGLQTHLLRPFPRRGLDDRRRIFNYRLTRARRYVECAFGILSSKWRVMQSALQLTPDKVKKVIQACVILHNYVRIHDATVIPEEQMSAMQSAAIPLEGNLQGRPGSSGLAVRDFYADYFLSPAGAVPWQRDIC
ncbi:uncharacterized protein [Dendropsophus ebraccatus]|uniref:uncharacterized protein n=1 Tax=Dendropsophus ebraccatus TaxID=150705 RepID=UPI00383146FA